MKRQNKGIMRMVGIAFMMALVVVMQSISGMIPPIGGFSISLVLIPIVLGAAVFGPGAGALLGATFGAIVYINCVTGADPGGAMVFQASPILCFLVVMGKGMLAGFASLFNISMVAIVQPYNIQGITMDVIAGVVLIIIGRQKARSKATELDEYISQFSEPDKIEEKNN